MTTRSVLRLNRADSLKYHIHPVVVFSILDQFRRRSDNQERVIGTLLGERIGNDVYIRNCFCVRHTQPTEESLVIEVDYHNQMLSLHNKINSKENVVGWYSTGAEISYISSLAHAFYAEQTTNPVFVTVDTSLTDYRLAVSAYESKEVKVGDKSVVARFDRVPIVFHAYESERIGVDALLKGTTDENDTKLDAPATIVSDLEALANSLTQLHSMLDKVYAYVASVVDGKTQGDSEVGRAIVAALSAVPVLEPATFEKMFNNQVQDLLMIVYLANLTRTQLALADKINGLLQ